MSLGSASRALLVPGICDYYDGPFDDIITPGCARGCPLDVTADPDYFDYSNEGDATVIEEVGNGKCR
jgi:hypothetical protein